MKRAEMRRNKREEVSKKKTFTMTKEEIDKIRNQEYQRARQEILSSSNRVAEEIFQMMLVIPTNVLIADHWQKSAKKRIPAFVEACNDLYLAWIAGAVDMDDMRKLTEEYAGVSLIDNYSATGKTLAKRGEIKR